MCVCVCVCVFMLTVYRTGDGVPMCSYCAYILPVTAQLAEKRLKKCQETSIIALLVNTSECMKDNYADTIHTYYRHILKLNTERGKYLSNVSVCKIMCVSEYTSIWYTNR